MTKSIPLDHDKMARLVFHRLDPPHGQLYFVMLDAYMNLVNPFQSNDIFHRAKYIMYNKIRMVYCLC